MTIILPEAVQAQGNVKWQFVPAVSSAVAPVKITIADIDAGVDLSCFLYEDALEVSSDQNKGERPRRKCSREVYEANGVTKYQLGDLMYSYLPQEDDDDPNNEVYATLAPGTKGFMVQRLGLDAVDTPWAANQYVDAYPAEVGSQTPLADTADEFAEIMIQQPVAVTGPRLTRVKISAT